MGDETSCPTPPPANLPPDRILEWRVSQPLWGDANLVLLKNGTLLYRFEPAEPGAPLKSGEVALEPAEVKRIFTTLANNRVCGMCRARAGIPDEAIPVLRVAAEGLDCEVEAWDGEWRDRVPEVAQLVKSLTERARSSPANPPRPANPVQPTPTADAAPD
jgi:hypothetical protein